MDEASAADSRRRSSSPTPRARPRPPRAGRAPAGPRSGPGPPSRRGRTRTRWLRPPTTRPTSPTVSTMARRMAAPAPGPPTWSSLRLGHGEQRRAPAAVAARGAEPHHVPLDHGDAQPGIGLGQVVGRPQAGEATTHHGHVHVEVAGQRRPDLQGIREPVPPQGEPSVPLARGRAQSCFHASVSTDRRMEVMISNSSGPQVSGGASCTTGSPRSSARQISPAS